MTVLTILLPGIEAFEPQAWSAMALPYVLFGRHGRVEQTGAAPLDTLPHGAATVLVLSARDTLLLEARLPPVEGAKLRRLLPNVVEEFLVDDPQRSHFAAGPATDGDGSRMIAVLDRDRFGALLDWFAAAGYRRIRVVPLIHCLARSATPDGLYNELADEDAQEDIASEAPAGRREPTVADEPDPIFPQAHSVAEVLVIPPCATVASAADAHVGVSDDARYELAVKHGATGFGIAVPGSRLQSTLGELARRYTVRVNWLSAGGESCALQGLCPEPVSLSWEQFAQQAVDCPFDLCQFEFANGSRTQPGAQGLRPWRWAIGLVVASAVVSIVAVNVQWWQLRHRESALNAQLTEMVKTAFPGTTVILDPASQMRIGLTRLRSAAGELRADDYLVLAADLARALGPIPPEAVATLDYGEGRLTVTFRPGTTLDPAGLRQRLKALGLGADEDNGKWTIASTPPASR